MRRALRTQSLQHRICRSGVVFVDARSETIRSITLETAREFLGRNGSLANPIAMSRVRLSGRVGAGLDPCAAILVPISLEEGQEKEIIFILGSGGAVKKSGGQLVYRLVPQAPATALPGPGRGMALLESDAWRGSRRNARCRGQLPGERLAFIPNARLPHVGADGILSVRRCVRVPRSVTGRDGPCACRTRPLA